jgi:hypothetical protein
MGYPQLHCSWELERGFSPKLGATTLDFGERWRFFMVLRPWAKLISPAFWNKR